MEKDQSLKCFECQMPIWMGKTVWFMGGHSYHPECVYDNPRLLAQWHLIEKNDKHEGTKV
jgi:hypothetical protein